MDNQLEKDLQGSNIKGHISAFVTIIIWGTTYISTKVLLKDFDPVEILFIRFVMGFLVLMIVYPHRMVIEDRKQEIIFALAGLTGITLYYLLENIALTYTMASNVGVIISVAPFFTAVLSRIIFKGKEKIRSGFVIGFILAMVGVFILNFGESTLEINPVGDVLALLAAFVWACYSILTKKISEFGYHTIQSTRRVFAYGLVFMIPALFLFGFQPAMSDVVKPVCFINLLYLGLGASAMCFVTWNFSVKVLGPIKTSVYIYIVPVITIVTSVIVLAEGITIVSLVGTALALVGLFISEK